MTREQLLKSLKINGKPVKVVCGQLIVPNFDKKEETPEEQNEVNLSTERTY